MSDEESLLNKRTGDLEKKTCACGAMIMCGLIITGVLVAVNLSQSTAALSAANHAGSWSEMVLLYMLPAANDGHNCDYAATNPCDEEVFQFGKCRVVPKPHQARCDSPCLVGGAGTCYKHDCKGACLGDCNTSADCPAINNTTPLTAGCSYGACIYNATLALPDGLGGVCVAQSPILAAVCLGVVDNEMRGGNCIVPTAACDGNNTFTCLLIFACSYWKVG